MEPLVPAIITALVVVYAYFRRAFTPRGIVAGVATSVAHAVHPWGVFFGLLYLFVLTGEAVTKVCAYHETPREDKSYGHKVHARMAMGSRSSHQLSNSLTKIT